MTMVDKDPTKAATIGALVTAGGLISAVGDNMQAPFEATAGKRNPKYAINLQYNGGIEFFYGSPYVVDFMNANSDPRLPRFFDKPAGAATYVGIEPGEDADDEVNAKLAATIHVATEPEYIFTYQEELFYEAEVYARGLGVTANLTTANTLYKKAIEQSAIFWGVNATTAATFAAGLPALTTMTTANAVKAINYQHWVDKMDRGLDAFTQWRRSGPEGSETPALNVPTSAPAGGLFRRYEYPVAAETGANPNAPALVRYNVKMWFDL